MFIQHETNIRPKFYVHKKTLIKACKSDNHINNVQKSNICKNYFYDIIGNTEIDTIKMCHIDDAIEIRLPKNAVIKVLPRINSDYLKLSPPIENIYIEPNNIQNNDKGIRIKIRNTDLIPDIIFMDLTYSNNTWNVEQFGIINTNSNRNPYIMIEKINRPINIELNSGKIFNPKYTFMKYFTRKLTNQSK